MNKVQITVPTVLSPQACSAADLAAFRQMVVDGGEVNQTTLPGLINNALALAFARVGDTLAGIGAVKRPNATYRASVFEKAGSTLTPSGFEFELGWFYVADPFRGHHLATKLIQSLLPALQGRTAYSTSKTHNIRMHSSLCKSGFVIEGAPYPATDKGKYVQLFIHGIS